MVIPAAGRSRRFGSPENKIWARLAGRTALEHTLAAFDAHPGVGVIVVVAGAEEVERVQAACASFPKVVAVVSGGETRADSVRQGLDALPPGVDVVLVHDAARPLVSSGVIDRVIEAAASAGAAVPGLPLSDTVKRVAGDLVKATVPRSAEIGGETVSGLTAVQTPQGARLALLQAAYAAYDPSQGEPTDEASLVEAFGEPVAVVRGDPANIKITRPEDVEHAERLLGAAVQEAETAPRPTPNTQHPTPEYRTGFGYDVHAFAAPEAGRKLFLGGVEIPHDRGLEGHSDADVLLHAACDALLGAASLGDIGILFPNTDPAYKGVSSLNLLAEVGRAVRAAGWDVINLDIAVVAEAPRLMPHRPAMQQAIAERLDITPDRVSVKATTNEGMGFVGRREGMAAWAVATVRSR